MHLTEPQCKEWIWFEPVEDKAYDRTLCNGVNICNNREFLFQLLKNDTVPLHQSADYYQI